MGWLELSPLFLTFDGHLASHRFLRVLLVVGEWSNRLVITFLARVRWFEGLIVFNEGSSLGLGCSVWDRNVLSNNLLICVELVCLLRSLRERLILHHGLRVFAFSLCEVLGPVVVIFHVGDGSAEGDLLSNLTPLNWVSSDVGRCDDHVSWILWVGAEVLLNLDEVGHVTVRGCIQSLLDVRLRLEGLLVAASDLMRAILLPHQTERGWLVLLAHCIIARGTEEYLIDTWSFLDSIRANIGWVDDDFFGVLTIGITAC